MSDRYEDKYRIQSVRLQKWDYGRNGLYFITLCTRKFDYYFGEIESGKVLLSEIGNISFRNWYAIPHHFSFIKLDEFVVMPNHVHGIIIIDKPVCRGAIFRASAINNRESQINNRESQINNSE